MSKDFQGFPGIVQDYSTFSTASKLPNKTFRLPDDFSGFVRICQDFFDNPGRLLRFWATLGRFSRILWLDLLKRQANLQDYWGFFRILQDSSGSSGLFGWQLQLGDSSLVLMRHCVSRLFGNRYVVATLPNQPRIYSTFKSTSHFICHYETDSVPFLRILDPANRAVPLNFHSWTWLNEATWFKITNIFISSSLNWMNPPPHPVAIETLTKSIRQTIRIDAREHFFIFGIKNPNQFQIWTSSTKKWSLNNLTEATSNLNACNGQLFNRKIQCNSPILALDNETQWFNIQIFLLFKYVCVCVCVSKTTESYRGQLICRCWFKLHERHDKMFQRSTTRRRCEPTVTHFSHWHWLIHFQKLFHFYCRKETVMGRLLHGWHRWVSGNLFLISLYSSSASIQDGYLQKWWTTQLQDGHWDDCKRCGLFRVCVNCLCVSVCASVCLGVCEKCLRKVLFLCRIGGGGNAATKACPSAGERGHPRAAAGKHRFLLYSARSSSVAVLRAI